MLLSLPVLLFHVLCFFPVILVFMPFGTVPLLSPSVTRSGKHFHTAMAPTDPDASTGTALNSDPPTGPASGFPRPSVDSVPLWSGNDPAYSIFTFIRRVHDAVDHTNLSSKEKVAFTRACMNCDTHTPSGAALEDDFYASCTDFDAFCDQLIKEFACISNDPCLASMTNFLTTLHATSGSHSPRIAAGLAGRFKTELTHALKHSPWLDDTGKMSGANFVNILGYLLFINSLTPDAAQLSKELSFTPDSTVHDLKLSLESKLRARPHMEAANALASPVSYNHVTRTSDALSHPTRPTAPRHTGVAGTPHTAKTITCFRCKKPGHHIRDCTSPPPPPPAQPSAPGRTTWCHYHKTNRHSADQCYVLQSRRTGKSQDFPQAGTR